MQEVRAELLDRSKLARGRLLRARWDRVGGALGSRTRGASDHGDDDFALGAAAFDVGEGLWGLVEGVRAVDDGAEDS